jgi:hypothetical protein
MKTCSKCRIPKDYSEFRKNRCMKDGFANVCKLCHNTCCKNWKQKNPDKVAAHMRANYLKYHEEWKSATRKWVADNPSKVAVFSKNRIKAMRQRTPKWLTPQDWVKMNKIYDLAKKLTADTGIKYSVDHILPIRGKNVSGLHVPQNLRVLPHVENLRKSNK